MSALRGGIILGGIVAGSAMALVEQYFAGYRDLFAGKNRWIPRSKTAAAARARQGASRPAARQTRRTPHQIR